MTTSTVTPSNESAHIAEFAQAVRVALSDLPAEDIDDLTDGLEADLSESFAEDLRRELPDPVAYATELRTAAGLPVRPKNRGPFAGLGQGWRDTRADLAVAVRRNPALAATLDFLAELRPAWWLLRAWVAWELFIQLPGSGGSVLPFSLFGWLVLAAFTVISVQWGRGRWLPRSGLPVLIGLGNVLALVLLVPLASANDRSYIQEYGDHSSVQPMSGIQLDGEVVSNIFAYGPDGKLLESIQLFDQTGRPLAPQHDPAMSTICLTDSCDTPLTPAAARLETGAEAWNVFPLSLLPVTQGINGDQVPPPGATPVVPTAPFLKVPAVQVPEKVAKAAE